MDAPMLRDQFFVGEAVGVDDALEGVPENVAVVAVVEPPLQFFEVTVKMLRTDLVKRSDDGSLEKRPYALDPVGMNGADNPLLCGVVDRLMARVVIRDPQVRLQFVGVDRFGLVLYRAADEVVQSVTPHVRNALKPNLAPALDRASNPSFVFAGTTAYTLRLAAHKGFVHFHDPEQCGAVKAVVPHCFPDAVTEIPCRAVGHAQRPTKLVRRHAFLRFAHEVDCEKPFTDRQVGVVHDRSRSHRELMLAGSALELMLHRKLEHVHIAAAHTCNSSRPPQTLKSAKALFVGAEFVH